MDISIKNDNFMNDHFDKKRLNILYCDDFSIENVEKEYAAKIASEVWLEVKGYTIPENLSFEERVNIFKTFWPMAMELRKSKPLFKFYKKFNVSGLKKELLNLEEEYWNINKDSSKTESVYKNTDMLGNTLFPIFYDGTQPINVIKNNFIPKKIQKKTDEIISELEYAFEGKVLMSSFTRLKPGNKIPPHVDDLYYFKLINRFQVAIATNSEVYFNIDKETKIFEEGECYLINNLFKHSIFNNGKTDRINLIVDILPWDEIGSRYSIIQWKNKNGR